MPTFTGTTGPDELIGSDTDDLIDGRGGADRILGRGGADQIRGVIGAVEVDGGTGDDTVFVDWDGMTGGTTALIDGGEGIDTLDLRGVANRTGSTAQVFFDPFFGVFRASVTAGATLTLTEFRNLERILGPATDTDWQLPLTRDLAFIQGGAGVDRFTVGGSVTVRGGGGSDQFNIFAGTQSYGETGDDLFVIAGEVTALIDGGEGRDTLTATVAVGVATRTIDLAQGTGFANTTYTSIENLNLTVTNTVANSVYQLDVLGSDGANVIRVRRASNEPGLVFGTIRTGTGDDVVETVGGDFTVFAGLGNDTVNSINAFGEEGDDLLIGYRLDGGAGDDVLILQDGGLSAQGGEGLDTLLFAAAVGGVNVSLAARSFSMALSTGTVSGSVDGIEQVIGTVGADRIALATGSEYAEGGAGADVISGDAGDDIIYGDSFIAAAGDGDDILSGDAGNDLLVGGGGSDQLFGGTGDDRLDGGTGSNTLDGGEGSDTAVYTLARSAVTVTYGQGVIIIDTPTGRDTLRGIESIQFADGVYAVAGGQLAAVPRAAISGTAGADRLIGTGAADTLVGLGGADLIRGGAGSDLIDGGDGVDTAQYGGNIRGYASVGLARVSGGEEGGTDTLSNIEVLRFLDGRLSFDVNDISAAVYRLYDAAFDRAPDVFGLADYSVGLASGRLTIQQVLDTFAASAEFQARYGGLSNEGFVREMYRFSLNRDGDAQGVAGYVAALDSGAATRARILGIFSESLEHRRIIDAQIAAEGIFIQDEATVAVARLYDSVLGRLPDLTGLQTYRTALDNGFVLRDIATALVDSPEFQQQFGSLSNQQFVEQLYRFVLDREGDAAGVAGYVQALNSGFTRVDVVMALSESLEHRLAYQATFDTQVRNLGVGTAAATTTIGSDGVKGNSWDDAFVLPAETFSEERDDGLTEDFDFADTGLAHGQWTLWDVGPAHDSPWGNASLTPDIDHILLRLDHNGLG